MNWLVTILKFGPGNCIEDVEFEFGRARRALPENMLPVQNTEANTKCVIHLLSQIPCLVDTYAQVHSLLRSRQPLLTREPNVFLCIENKTDAFGFVET